MFHTLSQYPDGKASLDAVQVACYCFMATVCESRRQLSVNLEMINRISREAGSSCFDKKLWDTMHTWGQKGRVVLEYRQTNRLLSHRRLDETWHKYGLVQIRDLIGEKGEVLVIRNQRDLMGILESEIIEMEEKACKQNIGPGHQKDPGFEKAHTDW